MRTVESNIVGLTRKQLMRSTNCQPYILSYLRECGHLPILHQSAGAGYPILYHPDAVQIIKQHLAKSQVKTSGLSRSLRKKVDSGS